jgi:hypothetical protein
MMTTLDLEELLNRRYYAIDFTQIIGDVLDFLDFSERNIDWQYKSERQAIRRRAEVEKIPVEYHDHLLANVTARFTIFLPTRVRYSAIVGLITAVDWSTEFLAKNASVDIPKPTRRRRDENRGLHILKWFNTKTSLGREVTLCNYENLITVRNAIVHSAGVKRDDEESKIATAVGALEGFQIEPIVLMGECITIRRCALRPYIVEMAELVPALYEAAFTQGLVRNT